MGAEILGGSIGCRNFLLSLESTGETFSPYFIETLSTFFCFAMPVDVKTNEVKFAVICSRVIW